MRPKHCIVIGGGLAGLSAAYGLKLRGWSVQVFEAQRRLGGRVRSFSFPGRPKLVCELGAEWIGESHEAVQRLCHTFDLELEPHEYATSFWIGAKPRKHVYGPREATLGQPAERAYERFLASFRRKTDKERRAFDRLDWWTVLEGIGLGRGDLRQRELEDGTDFGESIRTASAYVAATEYANSNATDELDFKVKGGNSQLIAGLEARIGRQHIDRGMAVTRIRQSKNEVHVTALAHGASNGVRRVAKADMCICAIPATRLRHIAWDPEPKAHLAAAAELQYSRITKTAVLYEKRFWPDRGGPGFGVFTTRAADFCFDSTHPIRRGPGILCSYSFGEKAANVALEDRTRLSEWISQDVRKAIGMGKTPSERVIAGEVELVAWHDEPWIGGAYAFYRPGQWFTVRPVLARGHGRVLFAGEHLSDDQGFMEGAVLSGQAAADFI